LNKLNVNAMEYPDGQKFFCIVWDNKVTKEFVIHKNEAEEFFPELAVRKAIKILARERFSNE